MMKSLTTKLNKESGQAVLIMVLIAAIGLIFFAVSLNWGRIAQIKTQTMIGANTAAMASASIMASDAQAKWQQNLGGDRDEGGLPSHCDNTNILMALVGVLLAVIAVVLAPFTGGCSLYLLVLAYAALAMAVINLALNVLVVQPGLTSMWNKLQKSMKPEAYFLETGIQTGVQVIATDSGQVPDLADMDTDGLFYGSAFRDEVSRYGFFYTQRLLMLQPTPIKEVSAFVRELKTFTFGDESQSLDCSLTENQSKRCCQLNSQNSPVSWAYGCGWQMTDTPAPYNLQQPDARNNSCCVPEYQRVTNPYRNNWRQCQVRGISNCSSEFVYRRIRPTGTQCSQGVRYYASGPEYSSVWISSAGDVPAACMNPQYNPYHVGNQIKIKYAYQASMQNYNQEKFSFLKLIGQDAIYAGGVNGNGVFGTPVDSVTLRGTYDFTALGTTRPVIQGDMFPMLWHMKDKLAVTGNSNVITQQLVTDNVQPPRVSNGNSFAVGSNELPDADPMRTISPGQYKNFTDAWWKPYVDGLCPKPVTPQVYNRYAERQDDSGWPYDGNCDTTRIRVENGANVRVPEHWHDDVIDAMASQGPQLSNLIGQLNSYKTEDLEKDFTAWYPTVAAWIAPECKTSQYCAANSNDMGCSNACSVNNEGTMREWRLLIGGAQGNGDAQGNNKEGLIKVISDWLDQSTAAAGGKQNFCVPPTTLNMSLRESGLYERNADDTIKQNIGNVDKCLTFHQDADQVFDNCLTQCSQEKCTNLPRSLSATFNPNDLAWQQGRAMPSLNAVDEQSSQTLQMLYQATPTQSTRDAIARLTQGTSCQTGSAFLTGIQQSRDLARSSKDVFERRANIVHAVYEKAVKLQEGLIKSYDAFNAFLGPVSCNAFDATTAARCQGYPAYALMKLRHDYRPEGLKTNNILIYGWQGPTATRNNKKYWHMARIEMKIPQLCPGNVCQSNMIPWIETKVHKFLFLPIERCYIMRGYPGLALARVTRWDEDRDEGTMVRFMNKVKLWKFTYSNPNKPARQNDDANIDLLEEKCAGSFATGVSSNNQAPVGMTQGTWDVINGANHDNATKELFKGAFMINLLQGQIPNTNNTNTMNQNLYSIEREKECLRIADQFLRRGVSSTACAQYYFDGAANRFAMKFVTCPANAFKPDETDYIPITRQP